MRSIWSGSITFGLVNIPVKLYSASKERAISFDFLHKKDLSRVRYARICLKENKEIPYEDIIRGYELGSGNYVEVDEKDLEQANQRKTKSIEIINFSKEEEVDPIYYEKPYYLEPDKGADKSYLLLKEALKKSKRVGIAKFVLRNKEHLAMVRPTGGILSLIQLRFNDEVRNAEELKKISTKEISDQEISLALALVDQLTKRFDPSGYRDDYTEELKEIISEKSEGKVPAESEAAPSPTEVKDLMEVLKKSLEETKEKQKSR